MPHIPSYYPHPQNGLFQIEACMLQTCGESVRCPSSAPQTYPSVLETVPHGWYSCLFRSVFFPLWRAAGSLLDVFAALLIITILHLITSSYLSVSTLALALVSIRIKRAPDSNFFSYWSFVSMHRLVFWACFLCIAGRIWTSIFSASRISPPTPDQLLSTISIRLAHV